MHLPLLALTAGALLSSFAQAVTLDATADSDAVSKLLSETRVDYVVVGGGNAGLALASRLSSGNSSCRVVVLEAGPSAAGNPGVDVPGLAGSTFGSAIDWAFTTTPQVKAKGRTVNWPRGKVLGGSSALNFLVSTRPHKAEHDQWASLSSDSGWSWSSLLPFYKKAEHFFPPSGNTQNDPAVFSSSAHGVTGPVSVSYPPYLASQFDGFYTALKAMGVPVAQDLHSGDNHGVSLPPSTMHHDGANRTRSYSVDYLSIAPNLIVIIGAQATKITWKVDKDSSGNVVASGVTFVPTGKNGPATDLNIAREVLLAAGTVQSPQLLELSGVGNPAILNPLGIKTVVSLPGVGENLQDHPAVVNVYKLKPGVESLDNLSNSTFLTSAFTDFASGQGILTETLYPLSYLTLSDFTSSADKATIAFLGGHASNPQLSSKMWSASQDLYNANVPVMELLSINVYFGNSTAQLGSSYLTLAACAQHSLSRGSVHITSRSPLSPPAINPAYLQSPLDLFLLRRAAQYLRKVAAQSALAKYIEVESEPGVAVQSEGEWDEYARGVVKTEYHPIGTTALLPRSDGGVVSPRLGVYGTANVRVVDLSIAPLHVSSHTQTVAYAIAEKAAGLILGGQ